MLCANAGRVLGLPMATGNTLTTYTYPSTCDQRCLRKEGRSKVAWYFMLPAIKARWLVSNNARYGRDPNVCMLCGSPQINLWGVIHLHIAEFHNDLWPCTMLQFAIYCMAHSDNHGLKIAVMRSSTNAEGPFFYQLFELVKNKGLSLNSASFNGMWWCILWGHMHRYIINIMFVI